MIDALLDNVCYEIGATEEMLFKVIESGLKNPKHKKYFEQIIATLNFMSFKKLMVKRNKELELEALQMLQSEGLAKDEEVNEAFVGKEQAELEHAIAVSLAAEAERKRLIDTEEEMIRKIQEESLKEYNMKIEKEKEEQEKIVKEIQRKETEKVAKMENETKRKYEEQKRVEAEKRRKEEEEYERQQVVSEQKKKAEEETRKKLQEEQKRHDERKRAEEEAKKRESANLPPVIIKKQPNVDLTEFKKVDISSEVKESERLEEMNKKIADKYQASEEKKVETGVESLAARQERLKRQRELLLKKKKEERDIEMQNYIKGGGSVLSEKLPELVSNEELERRKNIIGKIKESFN